MNSSHVRTIHGIRVLKNRHKLVKTLKDDSLVPTLHGHQIWQSAYMVIEYLEQHPLQQGLHIMDIGCGWGIIGTFCAKRFAGDMLLVDADKRVFPFVQLHARLNDVALETWQASFEDVDAQMLAGQDVVIGSDICFWPELMKQLKSLIHTALTAGVAKIILADPGRPTFLQLADFCRDNYAANVEPRWLDSRSKKQGYVLVIENPASAGRVNADS